MTTFRMIGAPPPTMRDADIGDRRWRVPEETPTAFVFNRRNYAVMLATPADLEDFAVGFSLTERIVDQVTEINSVDIQCADHGIELRFSIDKEKLDRLDLRQQRRNLVGRTGCGVCGLENAEAFFEPLAMVAERQRRISETALARALALLPRVQPLNTETRTVHAAAWCDPDGAILLAREDVGRHNALDKLLGAMVRTRFDAADGFVLMSSRCSYEIVEKAARLGVQAVASISAPTAFAIRKATEANMTLYAKAGSGFVRIRTETM